MKFKTLLIVFIFSFLFIGTGNSALESEDMIVITYELSSEVTEQVEEIDDNRNFLHPVLLLSYIPLSTYAIVYDPSFFLRDNFIDIEKPPIIS